MLQFHLCVLNRRLETGEEEPEAVLRSVQVPLPFLLLTEETGDLSYSEPLSHSIAFLNHLLSL